MYGVELPPMRPYVSSPPQPQTQTQSPPQSPQPQAAQPDGENVRSFDDDFAVED